MISQNRVKEVLHYNPETGIFTWRDYKGRRGQVAGCADKRGYIHINFDCKHYLAHRLAFVYMIGRYPKELTDHRDQNKSNNTWSNLREANHSQNRANQGIRADSKSGYRGVYFCNTKNLWVAEVRHNGKHSYCGQSDCKHEAAKMYNERAKQIYGDFACLNKIKAGVAWQWGDNTVANQKRKKK